MRTLLVVSFVVMIFLGVYVSQVINCPPHQIPITQDYESYGYKIDC